MYCLIFSVFRGLGFKIWFVCVFYVLRCVDWLNYLVGCDFVDSDCSVFFDDGFFFKFKIGMWFFI